jgi:hypothetical protein
MGVHATIYTTRNMGLIMHILTSLSSAHWSEYYHVGFEVFTAVVLKSIFFWDMTHYTASYPRRRYSSEYYQFVQKHWYYDMRAESQNSAARRDSHC